MPNRVLVLSALAVGIAFAALAAGESFSARCVRVVDGDTIDVSQGNGTVRVRLLEVDAPEMEQPYGLEAKEFLASLVANKIVTINVRGKDSYGRTLGFVLVGGIDTSSELVRAGFAWPYAKDTHSATLIPLEDNARSAHRGLWADPNPEAPWIWRERPHSLSDLARAVHVKQRAIRDLPPVTTSRREPGRAMDLTPPDAAPAVEGVAPASTPSVAPCAPYARVTNAWKAARSEFRFAITVSGVQCCPSGWVELQAVMEDRNPQHVYDKTTRERWTARDGQSQVIVETYLTSLTGDTVLREYRVTGVGCE
jgi:endonuclease YncB( thermonuclease family)